MTKIAQQTTINDYKINNPLPPYIADEYGELKWKLTVGKKPRGMWRPPLEITFSHTTGENNLNINPEYNFPVFRLSNWEISEKLDEMLQKSKIAPFVLFKNANARDERFKTIYNYVRTPSFGGWSFDFFYKETHLYYLEWRPGKPDYSDVLEWFAVNFCNPAVEEYNRRILEAYESEPLEETVLTSDDLQFQVQQKVLREEIQKKPSRKVKIK